MSSDSATKLAALEEEKRKMQQELEKMKKGSSSKPSDSASKLAALEEEKRKMQEELERMKRGGSESSKSSTSDSASKLAALEEEKRKMKEELERLKVGGSSTSKPTVSDSAGKLAALEEEKRKMQEELERLKKGSSSKPSTSDSATKLAALEEEKRKMQEEIERLKGGVSSKPSDSATKLAALEEEKRKMKEELDRLKGGGSAKPSTSDSATKLAALEEEKRKMKEELDRLKGGSSSKATTSDSATKLAALEEEKKRLRREMEALGRSVEKEEEDPEIEKMNKELEKMREALKDSTLKAESASRSKAASDAVIARLAAVAGADDVSKKSQELDLLKKKLDRKQRGVDVCILMDCTGSMTAWIREAAKQAVAVVDKVKTINRNSIPRVAFVGYRDIKDSNRFDIFDFVEAEDAHDLKDHLAEVKADGGGDIPEDIAGALEKAFSLNWMSSTKLIVHIADAPCHGKKYHSYGDDYPDGDPSGLVPEEILRKFASNKTDYYFMQINSTTTDMLDIFREVYRGTTRKFGVFDVGTDVSAFLPTLAETLSRSMSSMT